MPLITEMFAFIATEAPGEEGVIAMQNGMWLMPLIAGDAARVAALREKAQEVATASNKHVTLAHFTVREDLELIVPQGRVQ